jgi:flagellar assembly factor FliW
MQINTSRFGPLSIEIEDILVFPRGLIGFDDCRHWVLLADADNESLGWMQSVTRGEVAMAVVSPRRFLPEYRLRLTRGQLLPLEFSQFDQAYILTIISKAEHALAVNLKAPLVINLDRRLGRQVIAADEQPLALPLPRATLALRKSA